MQKLLHDECCQVYHQLALMQLVPATACWAEHPAEQRASKPCRALHSVWLCTLQERRLRARRAAHGRDPADVHGPDRLTTGEMLLFGALAGVLTDVLVSYPMEVGCETHVTHSKVVIARSGLTWEPDA